MFFYDLKNILICLKCLKFKKKLQTNFSSPQNFLSLLSFLTSDVEIRSFSENIKTLYFLHD